MTCSLMYGEIDLMQAPFSAQVGTSMGAWKSITSETTSLFLDGSAVTGDASANRTILLSVRIVAETRAARIAASELLIGEANRGTNVLVWTHDDGTASVVYETFRTAEPTRTDDESEAWNRREYTLTIPALPFARSNTRRTPSLSFPPGYGGTTPVITWGTTSVSGVVVNHKPPTTAQEGIPVNGIGTYLVNGQPGSVMGGVTAVSNCSVTSTGNDRNVVATAAGLAVAKCATPQSTSANAVVVGLVFNAASSADIVVQAGVEWFNGASSLGTDWGTPAYKADNRPVWAGSARPTAATAWGWRVRSTAVSAAQTVRITNVLAEAETFAPLSIVSPQPAMSPPYGFPVGTWTYAKPASTANISTQTHLQVALARLNYVPSWSIEGGNVTVRIHSSGGKWSAWYYRPDAAENLAFPAGTTQTKFFPLSTPDVVSEAGAAVLTAVEAVSVDLEGMSGATDDTDIVLFRPGNVQGGLGPGVLPPSTRGVVFDVDTILGSARSPAAVHASADTPLTNVVIQAVDPDDGMPLLQFVSSVATAPAPHGFDGVYSILGTRISGSDPVSPVMTITQKQGATVVATRALDGFVRPGGHYVDFGTISLPLVHHSAENVGVSLTFAVTPTSASWGESLQLNTNSPLMMLDDIDPTAEHVFIDEPSIETGIGQVLVGNAADRTDAQSPINPPILSLPFTVRAPGVKIFTYSTSDGPNIELSYYDRWLVEPA